MRPDNRALIALARALGGQDVTLTPTRGGHNRLSFTDHEGVTQSVILSKTPSDHRTLANVKAHIRRVLRPTKEEIVPMEETTVVEARSVDYIEHIPALPEKKPTYIGKVGHYATNLTFIMPKDLVKILPPDTRVTVSYLGDNSWSMKYGPNERLSVGQNRYAEYTISRTADPTIDLFPRTPAEYMLMEDDTIMVALINSVETKLPAVLPAGKPTTTAEAMRTALETIRTIEAATPYRLVRDAAGTLIFEAPVIR